MAIVLRGLVFRLGAVLIGTAGVLLALELALTLASTVARWHVRTSADVAEEGALRVLCLGESTTGGAWPDQLETMLQGAYPNLEVQVFKRYFVGGRTDKIAEHLPEWLVETRPHIAVTMLGINDEGNSLVYRPDQGEPWLVEHSRTAKLMMLLWRQLVETPAATPAFADSDPQALEVAGDPRDQPTRQRVHELEIRRAENERRFLITPTLAIQTELIAIDPRTPSFHVGRLVDTLTHGYPDAELDRFVREELEMSPEAFDVNVHHARVRQWGEAHDDPFAALRLQTAMARRAQAPELAERLLVEASRHPRPVLAGSASARLAEWYARTGRRAQAEDALRRARQLLPATRPWSLGLGFLALSSNLYELAIELLEDAVTGQPVVPPRHRDVVYGWLEQACRMAGHSDGAAKWRQRLEADQSRRVLGFTRLHYGRIVDRLLDEGVTVIAMQYPVLPLDRLRQLLGYRDDVIYLENRTQFDRDLELHGYPVLFSDRFAGAFGHLTERGNLLVAANVAATVQGILDSRDDIAPEAQ